MEFKDRIYPITTPSGAPWPSVVFLKNVINHSQIEIGDYTCNGQGIVLPVKLC
jgi:hypothetical protein